MQYTPGPWKWIEQSGGGRALVTDHPDYDGVIIESSMEEGIGFMNEGKNDADLIAAAPDMYEALEEAFNVLISCSVPAGGADDSKHVVEAKKSACKALAKANGDK